MRYFHRTTVPPAEIISEADRHFGRSLETTTQSDRAREYRGTIGTIRIAVKAEGGHYVHITVETDQMGESEADRSAKRFLVLVHKLAKPTHEVRGAY
jgi:hypothetical protein